MHKLAHNKDSESSEVMSKTVQMLFDACHSPLVEKFCNYEVGKSFEVPMLTDNLGATPIDLALGITNTIDENSEKELAKQMQGEDFFSDLELASVFLKNIKNYSYLHQGQSIVHTIIKCIELEVPGIADFLESRYKKIKTMPSQIQNDLQEEVKFEL